MHRLLYTMKKVNTAARGIAGAARDSCWHHLQKMMVEVGWEAVHEGREMFGNCHIDVDDVVAAVEVYVALWSCWILKVEVRSPSLEGDKAVFL